MDWNILTTVTDSPALSQSVLLKKLYIFVLIHPFSLYDDLDLIKVVGIGDVTTLVLIISIFFFFVNIIVFCVQYTVFITSFYVRVYKYKRKWKTVNINVSCFGLQPIWASNSNTPMGQDKIDAGSTPVWPCTSQTHIYRNVSMMFRLSKHKETQRIYGNKNQIQKETTIQDK